MSNTPNKAEIEALAQQHLKAFVQFSLGEVWFEGEVEFARAVPAKWGSPQPAPDCHHRPPCDECRIATQGGET